MHASPTLHDFVLKLLTNGEARSAFELDPTGALNAAGLADVSPADVRDLMPLVADVSPAHLAGLDTGLPQFATSALGADRVGVPVPLPVTGAVPAVDPALATAAGLTAATGLAGGTAGLAGTASALGGVEGLLGGAGAGLVGQAGLHSGPVGVSGIVSGDANAFSPAHDLAGSLDADTHAGDALGGTVDGTLGGALGGTVDGALGSTLGGALDGTVGGTVDGVVHQVPATVGDLSDPFSHIAGGVLDPVTSGVTGALPGTVGTLPDPGSTLHDTGSTLHGVLHGVTGVLSAGAADHAGADAGAAAHASGDTHLLDLPPRFVPGARGGAGRSRGPRTAILQIHSGR